MKKEEMANGEPAPALPPAPYPIAALSFRVANSGCRILSALVSAFSRANQAQLYVSMRQAA